MHELFANIPNDMLALMVVIPLIMAAAAITLGWKARQAALRRRAGGGPREMGEDALAAGITVAIVPIGFALLMLWGRFG
ncbi:MAG: hypothetical protein JNL48_03775 [Acidobacteria bacterium]|jgi:TRAP-type C4-dicarboxylate transport system permease small subunit|nr:hypothetical protein [Acidobacteriota bacterium]